MADDRDARIAQFEAENAALRAYQECNRAEIVSLHADAERQDRALATTLEQQTAIAEVLRVIASAPTDLDYSGQHKRG